MATTYLITSTFVHTSGVPKDNVVNTWHFRYAGAGDPITAEFEDARNIIWDFFARTSAPYSSPSLATYLSSNLSNQLTFRFYDLADPSPRVPKYVNTVTVAGMASGSGQALPSEVATVLSFQAPAVSGTPQARRRNRVYIGPLNLTALAASGGRPATAFINKLAGNATNMLTAAEASISWQWVVYSPTSDTFADVTDGWVDNAFDTQRRRGEAATSRTLWT